jgi:hypothetical protein
VRHRRWPPVGRSPTVSEHEWWPNQAGEGARGRGESSSMGKEETGSRDVATEEGGRISRGGHHGLTTTPTGSPTAISATSPLLHHPGRGVVVDGGARGEAATAAPPVQFQDGARRGEGRHRPCSPVGHTPTAERRGATTTGYPMPEGKCRWKGKRGGSAAQRRKQTQECAVICGRD